MAYQLTTSKSRFIGFRVKDWILSSILSFVPMMYAVGGIGPQPSGYLAIVYGLFCFLYLVNGPFFFWHQWLLLIFYLPFTIIISNPDPIFHSWERLALFSALFFCASPVVQSPFARNVRKKAIYIVGVICTTLSVGSFIGYFYGVNLFAYELADNYVGVAGMFSGLTRQSMMLAPISGFALVLLSYLFFTNTKRRKTRVAIIILMIMSAGSLLFASSRIGLAAAIAGILVVMISSTSIKSKALKRVMWSSVIICGTFPIWEGATDAMSEKLHAHEGSEQMFDSRSQKFDARIQEFAANPVFGVGFAAIDPDGDDTYNHLTGAIEPGSSWLGVLSMSGTVGFSIFVCLFFSLMKRLKDRPKQAWLLGLLTLFCVHMIAEGYVFAAGGPIAFLAWLTIGYSGDVIYKTRH